LTFAEFAAQWKAAIRAEIRQVKKTGKAEQPKDNRFGPHTRLVCELLDWIDREEILRFGIAPFGPFILVSDFDEALTIAQGGYSDGRADWTSLRENADASLYEIGILETDSWLPYKAGIKSLLLLIADKVTAVLPDAYLDIIDDVIADLHTCAICLAIHGNLNSFHGILWKAYTSGGWPCGCTGDDSEPSTHDLNMDDRQLYLFWKEQLERERGRI
jgi:hypothetical protein